METGPAFGEWSSYENPTISMRELDDMRKGVRGISWCALGFFSLLLSLGLFLRNLTRPPRAGVND
ncbi:MAG: hypothetical protein AAGC68_08355 [Verrucomicrobiota bacterium]